MWHYIHLEEIPIVPLYFADERPVVDRDGTLIMVDDDRMRARARREAGDAARALPHARLLPAVGRDRVGTPTTLPEIIQEMLLTKPPSARAGSSTTTRPRSMEKKKREGYF